ncbi:MAG: hypothetical protein RQ847_12950 [Wenzhouxiangellaceae bacterium]|nr:hypothetical protein [Wenzhouxiangellaceae bacterium]
MIKLPLVDRVKFFVERQFGKGAGYLGGGDRLCVLTRVSGR